MDKWNRINYSPCLPMGKDGKRISGSREHIELSRRVATEGIVLLKNNDNVLPLRAGSKIAVFGKAQYDYVKGGGSGDVNVEYVRNIYDALKIKENDGKLNVFSGLIDFYKTEIDNQYKSGVEVGRTQEPIIPNELLKSAKA